MGNEGAKFSSGKEKPAINIAYAIIKGSDLEPTWDIDQYFLERLFLMFQPKTGSNVWDLYVQRSGKLLICRTTTKKFFETLYKCLDIVTKQPSGGAANLTPGNMFVTS
jgi:hypothetical protein